MTRPFQYDNFVQSQIAMGNGSSQTYIGSGVRRNDDQSRNNLTDTKNTINRSKIQAIQKIDDLLGICRSQNEQIKNQFKQVYGAQKQIHGLLRQQLDQPPRFNNYARSNVQMFPGNIQQIAPTQNYVGYASEIKPRYHQSLPNQGQRGGGIGLGDNLQQQYYDQQQQQPYVTDYTQMQPQGTGYGSNYYGNGGQQYQQQPQRAQFLKSKVQQLKQQNSRLKNLQQPQQQQQQYYAPQQQYAPQQYQNDDQQIKQLKQQIQRLRIIVQNYQNQLSNLNNNPQNSQKILLLKQLKDQGQRIRLDTIALLKNKMGSGYIDTGYGGVGYDNGYGGAGYGSGAGGYGNTGYDIPTGGYSGVPQVNVQRVAPGGGKGLSSQHQAMFRQQLNQLRMQCQQLQQENANIKRMSKGTNYTAGSRRY